MGGGASSPGSSFTDPKEVSELHPYKSTPLVHTLGHAKHKKKGATSLTNNSKRSPTCQSVLKSDKYNKKLLVRGEGGVPSRKRTPWSG